LASPDRHLLPMNTYLKQRLDGLLGHFRAGLSAGGESATANRGTEREAFLSAFLLQALPPIYRTGTGEITDIQGSRSGQLDIVIEMPWAPSFGFPGSPVRLYPAEAVGVVIEVKSDVADQWNQVEGSAKALAELRQRLGGTSVSGPNLEVHNESNERIPVFAVGYKGWRSAAPIKERLLSSELDGVLVLEGPIFVEADRLLAYRNLDFVEKDASLRTHKRISELSHRGYDVGVIADKLNAEGLTSSEVRLEGDDRHLPNVGVNSWTATNVKASLEALSRRITSCTGTEALFAFVRRIHAELAKRSAMSVDLDLYA
jgi:hypothetical protein